MKLPIRSAGDSLDYLPEGSPDDLSDFFTDSVACLSRLNQIYGPHVAFSKGSQRILFASSPASNHLVFQNPEVFHGVGFYAGPKNSSQRRLGNGLFNLNGTRHKQHRRLLLPLFQKGMIDSYGGFLTELTDQLLAGWQFGRQYDLLAEMKKLALRITTRILFGLEDGELASSIDALFEQWLELNHHVAFQALLPVESSDDSYRRMLHNAEEMEMLIGKLVRRPRNALLADDVLALLLRARAAGTLSDVDVVGEVTHLFNAAYHTTTYALTWTLFLLAQHPDVMNAMYDERTLDRSDPAPLLDRCIKESLRVLPPVVYFARITVEPIAFGSNQLPSGTLVVGSQYVTHHLPELYPEPERFLPDRWLTTNPGPHGYIPYLGGARMCIGAPFAQAVFQTCLPRILRRFRLAVVPGARIDRKCSLTLGPTPGIPVTVHRPDGRYSSSPVVGAIHEMVTLPSVRALPAAA